MTELNRHKRAPDLAQVIVRLENYRDLPADLDFNRIDGFTESGADREAAIDSIAAARPAV